MAHDEDGSLPNRSRRRLVTAALLSATTSVITTTPGCAATPNKGGSLAQGIAWQVDTDHADPQGNWDQLGVRDLLVQWTAVNNQSFLPGAGLPMASRVPDWTRIANEPWASRVIVGLAGNFDETTARAQVGALVDQSLKLVAARPPVRVTGWYFPVEIDPTWTDAAKLAPLLNRLPRPLWVSVYDRSNIGGHTLATWLNSWLPKDVGVFFQDGCGVYARGPATARQYADQLTATLGSARVRIIAEAFRPAVGGTFRPALPTELMPQLAAYQGYSVFIFDGPHYVSNAMVKGLIALAK